MVRLVLGPRQPRMSARFPVGYGLLLGALAIAVAPTWSCGGRTDPHDNAQAKAGNCTSCHRSAYLAASQPVHRSSMPETCRDCHATTGWSPSTIQDHHWFPLANEHKETACAACHTKGYRPSDTPASCEGCHAKDYDEAKVPSHAGFPRECMTCHTDAAWKPSSYVHKWPLQGRHVIVACNDCHTGSPPKYEGTSKECVTCHQAAAAASKTVSHAPFPQTCLDCHVMSGWTPAISGLHPEAKFPRATGKHAGPEIACMDCHDLAKGTSAAGQNADCVNCHGGSHVRPAIDARHIELNVPSYPNGTAATNFCLSCHPAGTK